MAEPRVKFPTIEVKPSRLSLAAPVLIEEPIVDHYFIVELKPVFVADEQRYDGGTVRYTMNLTRVQAGELLTRLADTANQAVDDFCFRAFYIPVQALYVTESAKMAR